MPRGKEDFIRGRSQAPEDRVLDHLTGVPLFKDVKLARITGKVTTEEANDLRPGDHFPANRNLYKGIDTNTSKAVHRRARLKNWKND
jgi:hypothetical protein